MPAPAWLTELLREIAGHYECVPNIIMWNAVDQGEDGWEVTVFPAPALDGESIVHPLANVDVGLVLASFDGATTRFSEDDDGTSEVIIDGRTESGHAMTLALRLMAPEETPPATRILPGEGMSWEEIPPEGWTRDQAETPDAPTCWARILQDDEDA